MHPGLRGWALYWFSYPVARLAVDRRHRVAIRAVFVSQRTRRRRTYYAMFRGSIVDLNAPNAVRMFKP